MNFFKNNGPGIGLCIGIAIPSWIIGKLVPVVGAPIISIVLGMLVALALKDRHRLGLHVESWQRYFR